MNLCCPDHQKTSQKIMHNWSKEILFLVCLAVYGFNFKWAEWFKFAPSFGIYIYPYVKKKKKKPNDTMQAYIISSDFSSENRFSSKCMSVYRKND